MNIYIIFICFIFMIIVYFYVHILRFFMCVCLCLCVNMYVQVWGWCWETSWLIILYCSHWVRVGQSNTEFATELSLAGQLVLGIPCLCHFDIGIRDVPSCPPNIYVGSGHSNSCTYDCMTSALAPEPFPSPTSCILSLNQCISPIYPSSLLSPGFHIIFHLTAPSGSYMTTLESYPKGLVEM